MKVVIATPLYPPEVGGPATYATLLEEELPKQGIEVELVKFGDVRHFPKGVAHVAYFLKVFRAAFGKDAILALDPVSVGFPAMLAATFLRKPLIVRVGGDIVWERYVIRTKQPVTLTQFYQVGLCDLSIRERILFYLTKFFLRNVALVCFSTEWQRALWWKPYDLQRVRTCVLENYFPPLHIQEGKFHEKKFLWAGRIIPLKNLSLLSTAFARAKMHIPEISLETVTNVPPEVLHEKIKNAYALVLPSFSDISPNIIIEGVSHGKPFVMTAETGIRDRLREFGIFVDPTNEEELTNAICTLADDETYQHFQRRIIAAYRSRTATAIADEFIRHINSLG